MISLNSFRVALFKIQLRDIHRTSILAKSYLVKQVENELGNHPRPKRPQVPFIRYVNEIRPSIKESNPTLNPQELIAVMAKMWNSLDEKEKQKFNTGYDEKLKYRAEVIKYKYSLSDDDEKKIRETRAKVRERKLQSKKLNELRDLGRPKKPCSSFLNFLHKQEYVVGTGTGTGRHKHLKQVAAKWKTLTDDERAKYKSTEDEAKYYKALYEWEPEMLKQGRRDVVRITTIVPEELPKHKRYQISLKPKEGTS